MVTAYLGIARTDARVRTPMLGPVMMSATTSPTLPMRQRVRDRARHPAHRRLVAHEYAQAQHQRRQQEHVLDRGLAAAHVPRLGMCASRVGDDVCRSGYKFDQSGRGPANRVSGIQSHLFVEVRRRNDRGEASSAGRRPVLIACEGQRRLRLQLVDGAPIGEHCHPDRLLPATSLLTPSVRILGS